MKNQRERTEDQYLEYGARMRRERDVALERVHELERWGVLAAEFISELQPRDAREANGQAGLGTWASGLGLLDAAGDSLGAMEP